MQVRRWDDTNSNLVWVDAVRCDGCKKLTHGTTNLDGDDLCWKCANDWARVEEIESQERNEP
jgi:hypothetical protein